ncbi:hypothetical protein N802_09820 [Knoellia sinensis KCTC 19936]|uniref:DUF1772 domain-containing protein n=1 Tax=Knoellia sinensis KCTC 19936 TaxID=1385520 RepID=A0A0A0J3F2_9MICO|nr:anthrone oxygenase family protein [Knoellia sinensis]KGN30161.1 hypothetical protein N802_09820 [Knoellia sinensis KCTC 19936]
MSAAVWIPGATAVAGSVFAGAMFAFSSFVVPGLRTLSARDGIVAMQAFNAKAPQSLLALPMGGVAIGSLASIVTALTEEGEEGALLVSGGLLGLASLVVTGVGNVPVNNKIDALVPGAEAAGEWTAYMSRWTTWNDVRTVASLGSAVLLAIAAARA